MRTSKTVIIKSRWYYFARHHLYVNVVQSNIAFYFCSISCVITYSRIAVLLLLIFLWITFAVLPVSCENKSTTTHTTHLWSVRRKGPSFICMPNFKQIDLSIQSYKGVPKFLNWSRDLGHTHLGVILSVLPSLYQIWSAQFIQNLQGSPKILNLGHVTQATPT